MWSKVVRAAGLCLLLLGVLGQPAAATPAQQRDSATLTILGGPVQVAPPGGAFAASSDGQSIPVGARVRTGPGGRATLTFFDGTTAALDPDTELTLSAVEPSGSQGGLLSSLSLAAGRVWAQVTSLADRGSSVQVQAGGTTAVGREGSTGYRVGPDGTVVCWVIDGAPMLLRTPGGDVELRAGQQITLAPGQPSAPAPRQFGAGVLEVRTEGPVLPRLVDPANLTVGFPLDDLVVNQVLDATTSAPGANPRWIRVPGPDDGVYRLVLESFDGGSYRVSVTLSHDGRDLLSREWSATARPGERYVADLTVHAPYEVPAAAQLGEPRPLVGDPPGRFIYP
jgi:hypothetical protein